VQGFFSLLLERNDLARVHPERGRFRSFLLASLKHFQANERDRAAAMKRGGGRTPISLDVATAEDQLQIEPADDQSPDRIFDRSWARTVLERAKAQVQASYEKADRLSRFDALFKFLIGDTADSYRQAGAALGMTEGAVKTAVHRLRREYGEAIRAEIAQTIVSAQDVDDEIRTLFNALRQ
jgi:RNA polymerase sigma-70 factor (ECF subfamily)